MIHYFLLGLIIGLAYVCPIGTQNLYVINNALSKRRPFLTSMITTFWDIALALSCFFGIGYVIQNVIIIKDIILIIGSLFIIIMGIHLFIQTNETNPIIKPPTTIKAIIITCFSVTFLNPQAIIDGTLLFGSTRVAFSSLESAYFLLGSSFASLFWFNTLAIIIYFFRLKFKIKYIKRINQLASIIMILYGIKLELQCIYLFIN